MFDVDCACTIDMSEPGPFCLCKTSENHHYLSVCGQMGQKGPGYYNESDVVLCVPQYFFELVSYASQEFV